MRKEAERNTSETESKHAHLMTVVDMCYAKGMNPTISVKESLISTQNLLGEDSEKPTLSLINGAKRALHKIIVAK